MENISKCQGRFLQSQLCGIDDGGVEFQGLIPEVFQPVAHIGGEEFGLVAVMGQAAGHFIFFTVDQGDAVIGELVFLKSLPDEIQVHLAFDEHFFFGLVPDSPVDPIMGHGFLPTGRRAVSGGHFFNSRYADRIKMEKGPGFVCIFFRQVIQQGGFAGSGGAGEEVDGFVHDKIQLYIAGIRSILSRLTPMGGPFRILCQPDF